MEQRDVELDRQQREDAIVFVRGLLDGLTPYLTGGFRCAHQERGICPEEFWNNLFLYNDSGKQIMQEHRGSPGPGEKVKNPYAWLDFQACAKYLLFGDTRRLNTAEKGQTYAEDSYAVFDYFHIPYKNRNRVRTGGGLPASYADVLGYCMGIRNHCMHRTDQNVRRMNRKMLDTDFQNLKSFTEKMARREDNWEKRLNLPETLRAAWKRWDGEYKARFGGAPIPLAELGHEIFFSGEEHLTPEQQTALEQAVEYFHLILAGGKIYQEPDRKVLLEKLRLAPSVASLLHTPAAATPEEAEQKAEQARRPDADELPAQGPLEKPLWKPLEPAAARVLQRAGTGLIALSEAVVNALLDSFILTVDESILRSVEGRSLLTEKLAPALMRRREKLLVDESVVSRLFRDFRSSVPYTPLELAEMGVEPALAHELQEECRQKHTVSKTAIKALDFLRRRGCLEVAASPTSSEYSYENICYVAQQYPQNRFLVLTTDWELAQTLKDVYGRNAVAAKPSLNGQLLLFRSTAPIYQEMGRQVQTPVSPEPAPAVPAQANCLPLKRSPDAGDRVLAQRPDGTWETLRLGRLLGEGGEGQVYHTSVAEQAAKLYFPRLLTRERKEKLAYMLQRDPEIPGVCWPQAMLYNEDREWLGFLMPQGQGSSLALTVFHPGRSGSIPAAMGWTRRSLVQIAANVAGTFAKLHQKNILMCDVNAQNILVQPDCTLWLVDCDSYQVGDYRCPVGVKLYTPPEIHREMRRSGKEDFGFVRTEEHEKYSLAVLLFQILMLGKPPFESRNSNQEDVVQAILSGTFAYPYHSDDEGSADAARAGLLAPVGNWRNIWSHMPYQIKTGFYNVFTGRERLSAEQWEQQLREYIRLIDTGRSSDELMPDSFKVVENSSTRMVDLVCGQCGCHFNLGEDVYLGRQQRGEPILCNIHWGINRNMRRRRDLTEAVCGTCGRTVELPMSEWMERTNSGDRPLLCDGCLEREAPMVTCENPGCGARIRVSRARLERCRRYRQPVLCRKCLEKRKSEG